MAANRRDPTDAPIELQAGNVRCMSLSLREVVSASPLPHRLMFGHGEVVFDHPRD